MREKIFDIAFEIGGRKYRGWVNPADKEEEPGSTSLFHVVLNQTSFGYLSFNNGKWSVNKERPQELVLQVGKAIENFYQH